jgi:ATP-dependent exoDNAse (exonuclease V) alpha subunit
MSSQTLALEKAQLVVVDECSMLTSQLLTLLLHRLAQATLPGQPPKVLLLVGDMGQLPPICGHGRRSRRNRKRRSKHAAALLCPPAALQCFPDSHTC